MNLIRKYTTFFVLLAAWCTVLWSAGCAEQPSSVGTNPPGVNADDNGDDIDPDGTNDSETGSALGTDIGGDEVGSTLGGGVNPPKGGADSDVPGTETKKD